MLSDEESNVVSKPAVCGTIISTYISQYDDGSEFRICADTPIYEAPSERVISALVTRLLQTPVHESGAPGSLVSLPGILTEVKCSLKISYDS